jgi:hypothetical protein
VKLLRAQGSEAKLRCYGHPNGLLLKTKAGRGWLREYTAQHGSADQLARLTHEGKGHELVQEKARGKHMSSIKDGITNAERTEVSQALLAEQGVPRFYEIVQCPGCPHTERFMKKPATTAGDLCRDTVLGFLEQHRCRNPNFPCRTKYNAERWLAALDVEEQARKVSNRC